MQIEHFAATNIAWLAGVLQFVVAGLALLELSYVHRIHARAGLRRLGLGLVIFGGLTTGIANLAQHGALYALVLIFMVGLILASLGRLALLNHIDESPRIIPQAPRMGVRDWWRMAGRVLAVARMEARKLWARLRRPR